MPQLTLFAENSARLSLKKIILHLCADVGSDSKPYQDVGYDVRLVGRSIGVENYHPFENVYGIIANPVCTEFSVASDPEDRSQVWPFYIRVRKAIYGSSIVLRLRMICLFGLYVRRDLHKRFLR